MNQLQSRLPENIPGLFYVTDACIDCGLCYEIASSVFRFNDEIGFSIVYHQPENAEQMAVAEEALQGCPVEAIAKSINQ